MPGGVDNTNFPNCNSIDIIHELQKDFMAISEDSYAHSMRNNIDPKRVRPLPCIPKGVRFLHARFIGHGVHSEVYSASASYKNKTVTGALKFFSGRWKKQFKAEVHSY